MCSREKTVFLSVIVPIYNGEQYLDRLVSMIAKQDFHSFELILVDDGSTDGTYEKCKVYAGNYSWIQVIHTENGGVSHARNTGLSAACGTWIQFLDVDDVICERMFLDFACTVESCICNDKIVDMAESDICSRKVVSFAETGSLELVVCSCLRKDKASGTEVLCGPQSDAYLAGEDWKNLFRGLAMENRYWLLDYVWNKWYKKELIDKYHLRFDETLSLGEDFVFNAQYCKHVQNACLLQKAYYEYLVGENGLVSRFHETPWIGRTKLYRAQEDLYRSLGLWESERENVRVQAGQIAFGDLRTINRKTCRYSWQEKVQFVKGMLYSEQCSLIREYLKSRKSLVFRIYAWIFGTGNAWLITLVIYLEGML